MSSRRLKVLTVSEWYPSPTRPVEGIFVRESARAIMRRHDVAVVHGALRNERVTPKRTVSPFTEYDDEGILTVRAERRPPPVRGAGGVLRVLELERGLGRLLKRGFRPDLVHAHVYSAGFYASLSPRLRQRPLVVSEHFTGIPLGTLSPVEARKARYAYNHASVVCPDSVQMGHAIRELAPRARIRAVPNPVDTSLFRPRPQKAAGSPQRLICVALLGQLKGLSYLLSAFAQLRCDRGDLRLDLVGDGPLRGELERLAHELGVTDSVAFLGTRPKPEVADLMRRADAFVLPSLWDNNPSVLLEALASGLPIVATEVGGVPEIVDESVGRLVPPKDAAALAHAIDEVLNSLDAYDPDALGRHAHERYGFDAIAQQWDAVYAEVLSDHSGPTRTG